MNIDWSIVIPIILALLLLVAGGYIKKLTKEIKELVDVVSWALDDDAVDDAELASIIKEAKDVGASIKEIAMAVVGLINKKP